MSWLANRRRGVGGLSEKTITTELVNNNHRINGVSNGRPTYTSSENTAYGVIKINLPKSYSGNTNVNIGVQQGSTYTLFYKDDTYVNSIIANPNPNSKTLREYNCVYITIYKANKTTTYIKIGNDFVWDGSKEDWNKLGM